MNIRPLHNKVIIDRLEKKQASKGGIVIPETAKEKSQKGIILSVGPGKYLNNGDRFSTTVKEKDKVLFGIYSGIEVKLDDKEYLIMSEDDIIAIIDEN